MKYRLMILFMVAIFSFSLAEGVRAQGGFIVELKQAKAVAHACEGLLVGYARNPSLEEGLVEIYNTHVEEVKSLGTPFFSTDNIEAKGIISRALIIATARNPSLDEELNAFAEICKEDLLLLPTTEE